MQSMTFEDASLLAMAPTFTTVTELCSCDIMASPTLRPFHRSCLLDHATNQEKAPEATDKGMAEKNDFKPLRPRNRHEARAFAATKPHHPHHPHLPPDAAEPDTPDHQDDGQSMAQEKSPERPSDSGDTAGDASEQGRSLPPQDADSAAGAPNCKKQSNDNGNGSKHLENDGGLTGQRLNEEIKRRVQQYIPTQTLKDLASRQTQSEKRIDAFKKKMGGIEAATAECQRMVAQSGEAFQALQKKTQRSEEDMGQFQTRIARLESLIADLQKKLEHSDEEITTLQIRADELGHLTTELRYGIPGQTYQKANSERGKKSSPPRMAGTDASDTAPVCSAPLNPAGNVDLASHMQKIFIGWAIQGNEQKVIPSLTDALMTIQMVWPDRVRILSTAWDSAREASDFQNPTKAFRLLVRLVTKYWSCMQEGGGDSKAKKCFSDKEVALNESDGVDAKLRSFEGITMLRHLKIGNGRGTSNGWRCYFDYDNSTQRILIGWCGKHPNLR